jgi:putative folate metabolism gamma-glutamate ligase
MKVKAIKTKKIDLGDKLFDILDQFLPKLSEKDVVIVTSKIVSITQGRVIEDDGKVTKEDLIKKYSQRYLSKHSMMHGIHLTITNNMFVVSAGIDQSNGNGYFILWPENAQEEANKIWEYLRQKHNVKDLGVIITDSKLSPLRRGVTGAGISWCGFKPLRSYIGKPDIYGRPLHVEVLNIVDCVAAASVLEMGEAYEQTPLGIVNDINEIEFVDRVPTNEEINEMTINPEDDVFGALIKNTPWEKGEAKS